MGWLYSIDFTVFSNQQLAEPFYPRGCEGRKSKKNFHFPLAFATIA